MAKLSDREDIQRMTRRAWARADLDIKNLTLDKGKLCGGCVKPMGEQVGEPELYFGEKFCGACISRFKQTFMDSSSVLS